MDELATDLRDLLRKARTARRISQLELSLRLGVSQRHVSFVEGGRARPSRGLLLSWLAELETPLGLRNRALVAAGFAPAFGQSGQGDPGLGTALAALRRLIAAHDPFPAIVLDADWTVMDLNDGAAFLLSALAPPDAPPPAGPINLLDALCQPEGPLAAIENLAEVGPAFLARLRQEAVQHPPLEARVGLLAERLARMAPATRRHREAADGPLPPLLSTRFRTRYGPLDLFSLFTTFGTPQDITLASLRVEHFVPADAATAAILAARGKVTVASPHLAVTPA